MVKREDILEDLFHILSSTHWPNDKNNTPQNGANRVPKPPRTIPSNDSFPSSKKLDKLSDDESTTSCFDLDAFISSLDPNYSMEVQCQYNQLSADPPSVDFSPRRRKSSVSSSKKSSNWSVSQSLASIRQNALGSPTHNQNKRVSVSRQLSSKAQQVIYLLICEAFSVSEQEREELLYSANQRKKAEVQLELTLETTGQDPSVSGALKLLGGKSFPAVDLPAPLPISRTISLPVEHLWSQQLLVRFYRTVMVPLETLKANKKQRKKNKSVTIPEVSQTPPTGAAPPPEVVVDSTSVIEAPRDKTLGSKSLHRGLQGIRQSIRRKKKPKPEEGGVPPFTPSTPDPPSTVFAQGIKVEDSSTPIKDKKFQKFGSMRMKPSSPFLKFGKRGSSLRIKKRSEVQDIGEEPIKVTKEDLITNSKPIVDKKMDTLDCSNPFGSSADDLGSPNPFSKSDRYSSDLDTSNPFRTPNSSNHSLGDVSTSSKKKKSFRRSMRKTFQRIGSVRKTKKVNSECSGEEMTPLKKTAFTTSDTLKVNEIMETSSYKPPLPPKQGKLESPLKISKLESPPKMKEVTEELAYKMIQQSDAAMQQLKEHFTLGDKGLNATLLYKIIISFDIKCSTFELYRTTYEHLYKRRFQELVPTKLPLEGVDCNTTVDGEVLLKQIIIFSPMSSLRVALARYLVLVQAATGQMGTANTITALHKKQLEESVNEEDSTNPFKEESNSNHSGEDSTPIYDSKAETVLINPCDLLTLLLKVKDGLKTGVFSVYETKEALSGCVSLCRWLISHHLERLQTVFPVAGEQVSRKNLEDTLTLIFTMENTREIRDRFAEETAFLKIGGIRDHVLFTVRKYTQLWISALHKEFIHRRDLAMTLEVPESATVTAAPSTATEDSNRSFLSPAIIFNEDSLKFPSFTASDVAEKVPALLSSFVRTVKQFDNNKQMVYLADMVDKKYLGGAHRNQLQTGTLGTTVPMPMLSYATPSHSVDEDEISETVLRLKIVGDLMPIIVDYLDVASRFYDPIFKHFFQLRFLEECWQELVDGALLLWKQIGVSSIKESLIEPPLPASLLPQTISAVWSLCHSYSTINKLGAGGEGGRKTHYSKCMEDSAICWLKLISRSASLQLERDLQGLPAVNDHKVLEDCTRDSRNLIGLIVDKIGRLVWLDKVMPIEVLQCLADQLVQHLAVFWQSLYTKHMSTSSKANTITYWSCLILESMTELKDEVYEVLEKLDDGRHVLAQHLTILDLMPHKTAQHMCYEELKDVDSWVCTAAEGGGGGALVQKLDEALHELYDCLAPAQPLVACVRDRLQDAATKCLEETSQEEDFIQLAAVLEALQQFFANNILLEESLKAAECRWEELVSLARERGKPLAELQHNYYSQRYSEQLCQLPEDQTSTSALLVNTVFVENGGLSVSIVQVPSASSIVKASVGNNNNNPPDGAAAKGTTKPVPSMGKTTGMFSNMLKGATGPGGVYVKAQLVPSSWFPDHNQEYKTSLCKDDPAVIDEEISFPSLSSTSRGVEEGFLLLKLKLTRRLRTQVISEALVKLSSVPLVSASGKRLVKHSLLTLTKAQPLHNYEALNILRRRIDEPTMSFLQQLEHDNKGTQKAALRGSNTSLTSMW